MKYLKKFKSVADANTQGGGLFSPHTSIVQGFTAVNIVKPNSEKFTCSFDNDGKIENVSPYIPPQPNDEIWYTSSDGNIVEPKDGDSWEPIPIGSGAESFGANIVSNTYADGKGIIKFDGNVTSIGNAAFVICSSLTSIIIPNSVTSIENSVFWNCSSLTGITIPDSVTSIGGSAFEICSGMTIAIIGNSVTSIGDNAFSNCSSLSSIICNPTTPPIIGFRSFADNASGRLIKVPSASVNTYKGATNWNEYADSFVFLNNNCIFAIWKTNT